jgi:hypothetical protein
VKENPRSRPRHLPAGPAGALQLELRVRLESEDANEPGFEGASSQLIAFHADAWETECVAQVVRALIRDLGADPAIVKEALQTVLAEFEQPAPFWTR